jgi:predicted DNA-binding transcriptional regulator YafY
MMSQKFDSLMIILNKLDRKEKVTVNSLMDELEVKERTIYRYLQTLEVAGFPIHFDRQKGSYKFIDGYNLSKPDISVEESLAFALAKGALKSFGTGMEESLSSIEEKLALKQSNISGNIVLKAEKPSHKAAGYLGKIHNAIINFQKIKIRYKSLYTGEETERIVEPYYLYYPDGFWNLRAFCHLREEMRTFALDGIIFLRVMNENFLPKSISPGEELATSFGTWLDGEPVEVVLRFDKECVPLIKRKRWHKSQKEKDIKGGKLEVTFNINGLEDIKPWIYRWLPHVEVAAPKKLKNMIKSDLDKAVRKFK